MKSVFIFALLVAAVLAAPQGDKDATVISDTQEIRVDGYNFQYETSNGNKRTEEASLKDAGTETEALVVKGSFSYTAPDGQVITVNYIADENGYQPDNVPKA